MLLPLLMRAADSDAGLAAASSVTFLQAPAQAKLVTIPLAALEAGPGPQGYLAQRSPQPLTELTSLPAPIGEAYQGKEPAAFEIAALPNGTRYLVVLNEDQSLKFLNRNDSGLWYARIYRVARGSDSNPELLREGLQSLGNDVTLPVELQLSGIGTTRVKALRTEIGYNISGTQNGKPQVFSGRGAGLQVTGSQVSDEGRLTLTVTLPDEMTVTPDTQVTLRFEPLKPGLPERAASGKVTDFLTLGAARFVVTAMASDFSSATVAVVAGSLEQTLKQQLQLGAQMPPFSQVDLVTRKTVTREELLSRARTASGVVFVFGDLVPAGGRNPYGPPSPGGGNTVLPLPAGDLAEQLSVELQPKPLVVLVTRQISLSFLYEDLRNKTPDYVVLTDYTDPLRTSFRLPANTPGPWYGPSYTGGHEPSLRQLFNLPENMISVAAFDPTGRVVYVKADAGSAFLPSLAEARATLQRPDTNAR